jgi:PAS domain S-box-containing protein
LSSGVNRQPLRVLVVEDHASDAELMIRALEAAGYDPDWCRVESECDYLTRLNPSLDVILADFYLPQFDAARALDLLQKRSFDIPLIVVTGSIGEEAAVEVLRSGAADYLLKDRLARLGPAVQRAIEQRRLRCAHRLAQQELCATEERMRFALRASRVGIWEADLQTGGVRWSETLEALHGLQPGAFASTFEAFVLLVHPDDRAQVVTSIERATRERTDSNILYRTQWPDGTIHWISGIGHTLHDDNGMPVRATGIGLDVTERLSLEEQYRQAQKMEAVGQLAGGVAHDFNNILTAISGYCSLITDALPADSPVQADLRQIDRAAERATSLTRQLLAFSRRQILEPRVLDLQEAIAAVTPMLKRLLGESIEIVVRAREVGRIKADPGQIEQIILNLAVNARDAMPHGGTLLIEVANVSVVPPGDPERTSPASYVMIAVSDTGSGMDADTLARIFEPFFTTKQKGKGTGLGLSTVYGIVQQSGGYILPSSEPGRGATFKVYLPRVDAPVDKVVVQPVSGSLGGSETVLVVEDEAAVRLLVCRTLERQGYRVLLAATPTEALELVTAETGPIDLLLSDVILPEMSGCLMARQIIPNRPAMRVLYMSGYTDETIVRQGIFDRGTPFLQKPFTPEALARKVRGALSCEPAHRDAM